MLEFCILGSGSAGNSLVVRHEEGALLLDAGFSAARLCDRLQAVGMEPERLGGILVTHEHGDHIKGLEVFARRYGLPVVTTALTKAALGSRCEGLRFQIIPSTGQFALAGFQMESLPVPHDAACPVAFTFKVGGAMLGVMTDLGHVTPLVKQRMAGAHALLVEANYDVRMLTEDQKRPWSTKQRILGRHGHLSNDQAAEFLLECSRGELQQVVLGHLSRDCNAPEVALKVVGSALGPSVRLSCAQQETPGSFFEVCAPRGSSMTAAAEVIQSAKYVQPLLFG